MRTRNSMHTRPNAGMGLRRAWLRRVGPVLVAAVMCVSAAAGARLSGSALASQQFTGLAARVLSPPSAVLATDGRYHIVYELVLTNMTQFPVDVSRVDVRDARTHRVLLSLAGRALPSRMNPVGTPQGVKPARATRLASSGSSVVWFDVRVRSKADVPRALEHLVVSSTAGPKPIRFSSLIGRVSLLSRAPVVLGAPVRGGIWVADEGCCDLDTHHRRGLLSVDGNLVVPQRFAIDWIMLDRRHRAWVGNPARLSSYFSYGQPEIAAAAGTVVVARDGIPNTPPPHDPTKPPPLAGLTGNYVELRVGPGVYITYAHMKPGSVRVHVGQRVRLGQLLGQLGNSGNSATPHLHLQVQITSSFVSDGLPFVFKRFQLLGQITEPFSDSNLGLRPNGKLRFAPARPAGTRRLEMPLDRNVMRFDMR
jgi:Peptidase family M23